MNNLDWFNYNIHTSISLVNSWANNFSTTQLLALLNFINKYSTNINIDLLITYIHSKPYIIVNGLCYKYIIYKFLKNKNQENEKQYENKNIFTAIMNIGWTDLTHSIEKLLFQTIDFNYIIKKFYNFVIFSDRSEKQFMKLIRNIFFVDMSDNINCPFGVFELFGSLVYNQENSNDIDIIVDEDSFYKFMNILQIFFEIRTENVIRIYDVCTTKQKLNNCIERYNKRVTPVWVYLDKERFVKIDFVRKDIIGLPTPLNDFIECSLTKQYNGKLYLRCNNNMTIKNAINNFKNNIVTIPPNKIVKIEEKISYFNFLRLPKLWQRIYKWRLIFT
jgi:hypothetical protein